MQPARARAFVGGPCTSTHSFARAHASEHGSTRHARTLRRSCGTGRRGPIATSTSSPPTGSSAITESHCGHTRLSTAPLCPAHVALTRAGSHALGRHSQSPLVPHVRARRGAGSHATKAAAACLRHAGQWQSIRVTVSAGNATWKVHARHSQHPWSRIIASSRRSAPAYLDDQRKLQGFCKPVLQTRGRGLASLVLKMGVLRGLRAACACLGIAAAHAFLAHCPSSLRRVSSGAPVALARLPHSRLAAAVPCVRRQCVSARHAVDKDKETTQEDGTDADASPPPEDLYFGTVVSDSGDVALLYSLVTQ